VKIDDSILKTPRVGSQKLRNAKGKRSVDATHVGVSQDSVEITQASSQLQVLEEKIGQLGTSETGRLEAIRQAVAEGRFQVDEEAVADALVKSSIESLKRQGKK
jgi:negative regulator of flagellin synthesis FlgM